MRGLQAPLVAPQWLSELFTRTSLSVPSLVLTREVLGTTHDAQVATDDGDSSARLLSFGRAVCGRQPLLVAL